MNTTHLNTARLLSIAFAALLTLGTLVSVDHLAGATDASPQWAQATGATSTALRG
jgi:hypothetical protein